MDAREFRFGPFRLDAHTGELDRDGRRIPLEPLPTRILIRLLEDAGDLVGRQTLLELGWPRLPGAAEQSLNTCIRQIRHALGDDAGDPVYVETLRGRGYRFVGPVQRARAPSVRTRTGPPAPAGAAAGAPRSAPMRAVALGAAAVVLAFAAGRLLEPNRRSAIRVAVAPAEVSPGVPHGDVVGGALADELRAALATVAPRRLQVLGRISTERLGDGGDLGLTHRLLLSLRAPEAGALRVVARLVDVEDASVRWGAARDATPQNVGRIAGELALDMARELGLPSPGFPSSRPDVPFDARRDLARARHLLETHGDHRLAVLLVDSLLARHPGLADAQGLRSELMLHRGEAEDAARAAAEALRRDPWNRNALRGAAGVSMLEGDWKGAEATLRRGLDHDPNDPSLLNALAYLLTVRGRFDEAADAIGRSLRADPLSPVLVGDAGQMHLWAGRYEEAASTCRETLQLDPDAVWALGCIFDALTRSGRIREAAEVGRTILERYGAGSRLEPGDPPDAVVDEVRGWRVAAWEDASASAAAPYPLALAYADAGRVSDALRHLEGATERPTLAVLSIAVEPRLRPLHGEERFQSVVERLGLGGVAGRS